MERYNALIFLLCILIPLFIFQETAAKGCTEIPVDLSSREQFPNHYFTASSSYSSNHLPHLARIDSKTSWSPLEQNNPGDYLQIDLRSDHEICAIGTKGSQKDSEWITRYKLAFSTDNKHWVSYRERDQAKIFSANSDKNTLRKNVLFPHRTGRFIQLHPTDYHNWKSLRIEVYGVQLDNCKYPIGFENHGIDDSQITATSEYSHQHKAHSCRLYNRQSWRSTRTDDLSTYIEEYIQIDLGQMKTVTGVATQGDSTQQMWVTSYNLQFKKDGENWYEYTPSNDKESFEGNVDNTGVVVHWFDVKHHVRYIRLLPQTWNTAIALRMEMYGCQDTCDNQPIGIKDRKIISDVAMTSSSRRKTVHAHQGRLQYTKYSSWCASDNDNNPYLQIDLGAAHVLCAVATQGNSKYDQWVEVYTLKISLDGQQWESYREDNNIRKFVGNFDKSSLTKHVLNSSPLASYIRFLPKKYYGARCMRVEAYGTSHDACSKSITGASATGRIPGYRFSANSSRSSYKPSSGRLNGPSCWTAMTNNKNVYLQIDLGDPHVVCGVGTQGCDSKSEKVLTYNLAFSMDGLRWEFYRQSGREKIFEGNQGDEFSVRRHSFINNIPTARFIRFFPIRFLKHKSMRVEIYGLRQAWRGSLGVEADHGRTNIPDNHLTASSDSDPYHREVEGRLYGSSSWCTKDSHNPYFQVDLGAPKEVVALATQGDPLNEKNYVKQYHIHYGFTSDRWMKVENVQGNTDGNTVRVYWMHPTVGARYVRFLPSDWNSEICMRVDLYGNLQVPPPKITSSEVIGKLVALPSSHVTIRCLATADSKLHFKWFSPSSDITNKCGGDVYSRGIVSSTLQVNFTSAFDILSSQNCISVNKSSSRCRQVFTCQAFYGDIMGERKQHAIDVTFNKELLLSTTSVAMTPFKVSTGLVASGIPTAESIADKSSNSSVNFSFSGLLTLCFCFIFSFSLNVA